MADAAAPFVRTQLGGSGTMTTSSHNDQTHELHGMKTPQIVSREEWKTAWQQMLVKEKAHTRAGDALAAEPPADAMVGRREGL